MDTEHHEDGGLSWWPYMIGGWLLFVVMVNMGFIYTATQNAPEVSDAYVEGHR